MPIMPALRAHISSNVCGMTNSEFPMPLFLLLLLCPSSYNPFSTEFFLPQKLQLLLLCFCCCCSFCASMPALADSEVESPFFLSRPPFSTCLTSCHDSMT